MQADAGSKSLNFYVLRWSLDLTEAEKEKLQLQIYLKLGETIICLSVYWLFCSILHFCFFCDLYSYRVYIFVYLYIHIYGTYEYQHIRGFVSSLYTIYPFAGKRVRKGGSLEHHVCFKMYGHLSNDLPKTPGKNSLKRMHVP